MELNINFKIDVTERTSACVTYLISSLRQMMVADSYSDQQQEQQERTVQQEQQERAVQQEQQQEHKPTKTKTKTKAKVEPKPEPKPEPETKPELETKPADNPDTAQNVGNDMPMDDGSRKEGEEKSEAQGSAVSRDELISEMRRSMNECMERFIGPDYKNQTNSPKYKKYNGMLRTYFMRAAQSYVVGGNYKLTPNEAMKPSMLNEQDLRLFINEVDLLIPDPETGEISKKNIF